MKKLEAIVEPFRLNQVKEALADLGITGMTVTEVRGLARQQEHCEIYRGSEYVVDLLPKIKLELVLEEHEIDEAMTAILKSSKTAGRATAKVFVSGIDEATVVETD